MFKEKANTVFNNVVFSSRMIRDMKREIHPQMVRLYHAAKTLKNTDDKTAVATLLNQSYQTVHNWENRGISLEGLIAAQENIGCDAVWLRDGTGEMVKSGDSAPPDLKDVAQLIEVFGQLPQKKREMVLRFARSQAGSTDASTANDKSKFGPGAL